MNTPLIPIAQSISEETLERIRMRLVQIIAAIAVLRFLFPGLAYELAVYETPVLNVALSGFLVIFVFALWFALAMLGRVNLAITGLVLTLIVFSFMPGSLERFHPFIAVVAVSTLVADWRRFSALTVLLFGVTTWRIAQHITGGQGIEQTLSQMGLVVAMATASITIRYFVNSIQQTLNEAEQSANLLRIAAEVGQITVGMVALDQLLPRAVDFIRDRFGYYHVQIFLVDDDNTIAWLKASTGGVGQQLLAREHHLNVGSNSVIGQVTQTGETVIAREDDPFHARNELLPDTRVELAMPIRDGERVIGALDVQSLRADAFPPGHVQALQIMTNLLGASIRNAILFEEQKRNMQDNQRLYLESEANLREIRRLNRQLTRDNWLRFIENEGESTGIVLSGSELNRTATWSDLLTKASQSRQIVAVERDEHYAVAAPIILRGEVIGAIEIEPDPNLDETDAREIARAISERLAVALENARLFEESRATTLYEQQINRIVSQYQNVSSVDELLQITLEELSETLDAAHSSIRLSSTQLADEAPTP